MTDLPFVVRDLGSMPYAEALAVQRALQLEVINSRRATPGESTPDLNREGGEDAHDSAQRSVGYLLLVEHDPPVITISRRKGASDHLLADRARLSRAGVELAETDRGGDITYHGPGQLVVYPIFDLNMLGLRLHGYMRMLEQIVIDLVAEFGIAGTRDDSATGVWVDAPQRSGSRAAPTAKAAKISAMGVRVSRWVSMHGLALNVATNLEHFELIVPCGLHGRTVTSMRELLGDSCCPTMSDVKQAMIDHFARAVAQRISVSA